MSNQEKAALFNLIVLSIAIILFLTLFLKTRHENPDLSLTRQMMNAFPAYAITGFMGLSGWIFRTRDPNKDLDERDLLIQRRSYFVGFRVFWITYIGLHMGVWWHTIKQNMLISPNVLIILLMLGFIVFTSIQSVTLLLMYRRGITADPEGN